MFINYLILKVTFINYLNFKIKLLFYHTKSNNIVIQFPPVHTMVDKITHINYAFTYLSYDIDEDSWFFDSTDTWADFGILSVLLFLYSFLFSLLASYFHLR